MNTETLQVERYLNSPESVADIRKRIETEFSKLEIGVCPPEILDHYVVLEQNSDFHFESDPLTLKRGAENVFVGLEETGSDLRFTSEQKREVLLATLLGDIGKSSDSEYPSVQLAVTELFSVHDINENQTVDNTLKQYFVGRERKMLSELEKVDVHADTTMRKFWDRHATWTNNLLLKQQKVLGRNVITIASSHHINKGIDPCGIIGTSLFEVLKYRIFILMAVDKYHAKRYRGKGSIHEEAINYLKAELLVGKYKNDTLIESIIDTIDRLGKNDKLFTK